MKKKRNIIIVLILIILILLSILLYVLVKDVLTNNKKDTDVVNKAVINSDLEDTITKEEAIKIGKELYEYTDKAYFGHRDVWPSHFVDNENGEGQTLVCDTTAEEVKQKFSKDFKFEQFYDDSDDVKYSGTLDDFIKTTKDSPCGGVTRGTLQNYINSEISDPVIKENKITFKATSNYCSSSFCHEGDEVNHKIVKDFIIIKINGEWYIEYYAITR